MDPSFFGTWETDLSKTTGIENIGKALGLDNEKIELYKNLSYTYKIAPAGDGYQISVDFKGGIPSQQFVIKLGEQQEYEYTSLDGDTAKVTMQVSGKAIVENHVVPSKNLSWVITRTVEGNTIKNVMEAGGASATSILNKI